MSTKTAVMSKAKKNECEHRKVFMKMFNKMAYKHSSHTVWRDLMYMSAAAMSQPVDFRQYREDEYLRIINSYDKAEQELFVSMFGELILAFEEEGVRDILGELYAELDLTNAKQGQFFTPFHISKMMAAVASSAQGLRTEIEQKGYVKVGDPCCGAGGMLIAFAAQCVAYGVNYQHDILFVAQDIDLVVALTCHVQMSLLGMAGYVIIGNSLSNAVPGPEDIWYTPMYALSGFHLRNQKTEAVTAETTEDDIDDIDDEADNVTDIVCQSEPQETAMLVVNADDDAIDIILRETENGQFAFDF